MDVNSHTTIIPWIFFYLKRLMHLFACNQMHRAISLRLDIQLPHMARSVRRCVRSGARAREQWTRRRPLLRDGGGQAQLSAGRPPGTAAHGPTTVVFAVARRGPFSLESPFCSGSMAITPVLTTPNTTVYRRPSVSQKSMKEAFFHQQNLIFHRPMADESY
jgi:hypothetical protein